MNRFHAPEGSITENSVRQAFNHEYMVPVEAAWEIEQELNRTRAECETLRELYRQAMSVLDNTQTAIAECIKLVEEIRK